MDKGMSTNRCQICDKEFQLMSMDLHIATCQKDSNQMGKSKKILKTQKIMKKHLSTVHENKGKTFTCNICANTFQTKNILTSHMKTIHEGHKDYKCKSCGKLFSQAGDLKRHIHTIHEGHKDYKCKSCG